MKTIILLSLAFLFTAFTANAQINDGKFLLGGNVFFNNQKNTLVTGQDIKSSSAGIRLRLGKFISSTSAIGVIVDYNHADAIENRTNSYGIGVFYRKYKSLGSNFYLFGEGNIKYSYGKSENKNNINKSTINTVSLHLLPGISYSITPKIQMELTIPNLLSASYSSSKLTSGSPQSSQNSFSIGAGLNQNAMSNIGIGFKLIL